MEPEAVVSVKEVAELLLAARGRIDFYWNFYLAVVVAVVGWLMSRKLPFTVPVKLLLSLTYLIAAGMNFAGLFSSYTLAEALRTDLLAVADEGVLENTRLLLAQHSYSAQRVVALLVHLAIGVTILLVIWFGRLPSARGSWGDASSN